MNSISYRRLLYVPHFQSILIRINICHVHSIAMTFPRHPHLRAIIINGNAAINNFVFSITVNITCSKIMVPTTS